MALERANQGLDAKGPAHPLLVAKFHEFMRAFVLAGDGGTTSFGDKVTTGEKDQPTPQSSTAQEIGYYDRAWRRCKTNRERLELLAEMQPVVTRLRFAPHSSTRRGTLEWRVAIAHDERAPEDVWATYDISRTTYYRIRQELNPNRPKRR